VLAVFTKRHAQAFGAKTTHALGELAVAVIGCSGTGSPTIAQLAHLGIARLVLVDPDYVLEHKLNRILYALGDAVERIGLGTMVE
jgi:tRNA A37 threonylcarbamoyladenosine dehydratase